MAMTEKEWNQIYDENQKIDTLKAGKITDQKLLEKIAMLGSNDYKNDSRVGVTSIDWVYNEESLIRIAKAAEKPTVRIAAIQRIASNEALIDIVENSNKPDLFSSVTRAAIERITDEAFLITSIMSDTEGLRYGWMTRVAAVKRINDEAALKNIATTDKNEHVRWSAIERISDETFLIDRAVKDIDYFVRRTAVEKITDEETLMNIANTDKHESVRVTAVNMVTDKAKLFDIAKTNKHWDARRAAVGQIVDENALRELSEMEESAEVLYIITNRIVADETVWLKIAKSASFWNNSQVISHITNEDFLIELAQTVTDYNARTAITEKIKNKVELQRMASDWEARGYKCFSSDEVHAWEKESYHSHGWDYETWKCKLCGKKSESGEWVDSR